MTKIRTSVFYTKNRTKYGKIVLVGMSAAWMNCALSICRSQKISVISGKIKTISISLFDYIISPANGSHLNLIIRKSTLANMDLKNKRWKCLFGC